MMQLTFLSLAAFAACGDDSTAPLEPSVSLMTDFEFANMQTVWYSGIEPGIELGGERLSIVKGDWNTPQGPVAKSWYIHEVLKEDERSFRLILRDRPDGKQPFFSYMLFSFISESRAQVIFAKGTVSKLDAVLELNAFNELTFTTYPDWERHSAN